MSFWNLFTLQQRQPQYFTKNNKKIVSSTQNPLILNNGQETSQNQYINMDEGDEQMDEIVDPYDSQITLHDLQTYAVKHEQHIPQEQKRKWSMCSQEQHVLEQCVEFNQKLVHRSFNMGVMGSGDCGSLNSKFNDCRKINGLL